MLRRRRSSLKSQGVDMGPGFREEPLAHANPLRPVARLEKGAKPALVECYARALLLRHHDMDGHAVRFTGQAVDGGDERLGRTGTIDEIESDEVFDPKRSSVLNIRQDPVTEQAVDVTVCALGRNQPRLTLSAGRAQTPPMCEPLTKPEAGGYRMNKRIDLRQPA